MSDLLALALTSPLAQEQMTKLAACLDTKTIEKMHKEAHKAHCDCCFESGYTIECSGNFKK